MKFRHVIKFDLRFDQKLDLTSDLKFNLTIFNASLTAGRKVLEWDTVKLGAKIKKTPPAIPGTGTQIKKKNWTSKHHYVLREEIITRSWGKKTPPSTPAAETLIKNLKKKQE